MSSSVTTATDGAGVIVPFVGDMFADASGTVGTLETSAVTMSGLDTILSVTVGEADAKAILQGFKITELDEANETSADVNVEMQNGAAFQAALENAINMYASGETSGSGAFYNYLYTQSRAHMVSQLDAGGLADLLEATDLLAYDIVIDASGAASSMFTKMSDAGAAASRRVIFTQIEKAKIDGYVAAGATEINHLPLNKGDVITFVWDAKVGEAGTSSGAKITAVASPNAPSAGASAGGNVDSVGNYFGSSQVAISNPTSRRVALKITLGTGSGAFSF
jgi:hypothetical protein